MTQGTPHSIEAQVEAMKAEIYELLPRLVDDSSDGTQGLLRIACPDPSDPILKEPSTEESAKIKALAVPGDPITIAQVLDECASIFRCRAMTQHPSFFSFIPSTMLPVSWLADVVINAFNAHVGGHFAGSGCNDVEKSLMGWFISKIGFPAEEAVGLTVSGGSMANLMAMTAARDKAISRPEDHHRAIIYVSDASHFSIAKTARILGFSGKQIRQISGLQPDSLADSIRDDRALGLIPMVVVATLGSTPTGSIDPLSEVAEVAAKSDVWLHIDGAYGSSILLSSSYRHLANGVEKADSITWDAHKWLFSTYGCGMLFVRDKKCLAHSFAAHSEFIDVAGREADYEYWDLSLELTRPARAMRLWFILRILGTRLVGQMLDHGVHLAEEAEAALRVRKYWKIKSPAQLAILVFRYEPNGHTESEVDLLNEKIADVALDENTAAIRTIRLKGQTAMRMCIINPRLTTEQLAAIIDALDHIANRVSL
jgi:glutamate/tyrosine decarboxylase-like PLP-dependent enzyme